MVQKYFLKVLVPATCVVLVITAFLFACQVPRIARLSSERWEPDYSSFHVSETGAGGQSSLNSAFADPPFQAAGIPRAIVLSNGSESFPGTGGSRLELEPEKDAGLVLYRSFFHRDGVLEFYTDLTGSRRIASAILEYADRFDVPASLAFSVAWAESEYHPRAVHKNIDSVDRGLFQLNSKSFPKLSLEEFFDPETSARYGIAYLAYCLTMGGNDVVALAMYNAGPNRVEDRGTPRITLDYIHKIIVFRENLEEMFLKKFSSQINVTANAGRYRAGRVSLDIMDRVK